MRDIVRAIKAFIAVVVSIFRPVYEKFIGGGQTWWNLIVLGALTSAGNILTTAAPLLAPIAGAFRGAIPTGGGPILATLKPGFVSLANSVLAETSAGVTGFG